nr:hypothetical protein [Tanacetum cinerariifolium]
MGRDTVQLETAVSTISQEYLLEFTSEYGPAGTVHIYTDFQLTPHLHTYNRIRNVLPRNFTTPEYGISEALHPELPGPEDRIVDFPEGKNSRFFWVDERVFPTVVDWRTSAPKYAMPAESAFSSEAVRILDTHRTPIQKQPEALLCLVGLSRRYYLGDEVYPTFLYNDDRANRVIEVEDPAPATDLPGVPFTIERSPLDFANEAGPEDQETVAPEVPLPEDVPTTRGVPEVGPAKRVAATDPPAVKKCRKRGHDGADANAPPKVLRRDHADPRLTGSTREGKSFASIELGTGSTRPTPVPQSAPADVGDPDPLSFADPRSRPPTNVASKSSKGAAAEGDPKSENTSFASMVGSPESIYRLEWVQRKPGPVGGNRVATAPENREALLEAEADMKKVVKDKSAKLSLELEDMRALLSDHQVSNERLSQQVSTLQEQVRGPMDPWACKEEMLVADAIAANVSRAEKKKKCRVVGRTHRVSFAHHARSDGVSVSVPTVVPQGLAILLADAATQTESDEVSQLLRSSSLPVMRN